MKLIIGDKTYSSWSLRPWLVMKRHNVAFTEIKVQLRGPHKTDLSRFSPTSRVPVLLDGDITIWDTLAIADYLNDIHPEWQLWPKEIHARVLARSASAEMHSGFADLRHCCSMDLSVTGKTAELTPAAQTDLIRLVNLFKGARKRFGSEGAFLAGPWSIADAFFTPVATRIRTYGIDLAAFGDDGTAKAYVETLLVQPEFKIWEKGAADERAGIHH